MPKQNEMKPEIIMYIDQLKRKLNKWRVLFFIVLTISAVIVFNNLSPQPNKVIKKNYIARIYINDVIFMEQERLENLRRLEQDHTAKAVIVHINSPGGSTVGGESLYNAFKRIAEVKPVVMLMDEVAASGGYMTAVAGERIYAHRSTITGSIGVIMQSAEVTELAEKIGVNFSIFKSSPLKAAPSPMEKVTEEARRVTMEGIEQAYNVFLDIVEEGRKIERNKLKKIADGRVYLGDKALELGLIDAIGGEREAIQWLEEDKGLKNIPVEDYHLHRKIGSFERLLNDVDSLAKGLKINSMNGIMRSYS
jgi:protease-4